MRDDEMSEPIVDAPRTAELSLAAVEAASERTGEPAWMRERRREAWRTYEGLPLPDSKSEEWRRTDISGLRLEAFRPVLDGTAPGAAGLPPHLGTAVTAPEERAGLLAQRDGHTVQSALDEAVQRQGVLFLDLDQAVRQVPDLVREHFLSLVSPDELKFRALHAALRRGGTFLYVPPGVEVALPLVSGTWVDTPGAAVFPHTLLVAGAGSKVTLIELFGSPDFDRQTLVAGAAELVVQDGAQVQYVSFQEWCANVWEFGLVRGRLGRDASVRSLIVAFGGALTKTDVETKLAGPGAQSEMLGLYFADGSQHFAYHTLQEHLAPHTLSDLLYKGAVKDRGRTVFAGLIRVHPGAQKTNAFQSNRNLILNSGAKSDSIPKLEIMANDLRCTHGSATSRLNEEHLFYLMSRGLRREQAVQMVVDGFFAEVLDKVSLPRLAERMQQEIAGKIAEL
jgi:Fe-S cluster assembly protein SufD